MPTVTVIINDYETDRRTLSLLEDSDFERVIDNWHNEDRILVDMQENAFFAGRTRWSEIGPSHWRLMIASNLARVAKITDDARSDADNAVVRSLNFLICGLIFCLQQRAESQIELMHINRIHDGAVVYDYQACLNMAIDMPKAITGLRVVIDNG